MESLLFLVHRLPYPPNKGDKIRSYHMLKHLSESYQVFLGTFIDDKEDWQYQGQVKALCKDTLIRELDPFSKKIKSLKGFISGKALTLPYYYDSKLQQWVDDAIRNNNISKIVVFSSSMAQYVDQRRYKNKVRVIDFVDVDSDKWLQYSNKKSWPESYIYKREAKYLLNYEKSVASTFSASLFVSDEEAKHFSSLVGKNSSNIDYFNNGVDCNYFKLDENSKSPYRADERAIVFTGAMDYWANVDAVSWFAEKVFPELRDKYGLSFYIVGSNPSEVVKNLVSEEGVVVTGRVPDIRPYLAFATIAVAPMRIARGIQNKVLEAMAMESCVIATSSAVEGIKASHGHSIIVADSEKEYIQQVADVLDNQQNAKAIGAAARKFVLENFSWHSNLSRLDSFLVGTNVVK